MKTHGPRREAFVLERSNYRGPCASAITQAKRKAPAGRPQPRQRSTRGNGRENKSESAETALNVFEQLFGGDFKIELRQPQAGVLEQAGFRVLR